MARFNQLPYCCGIHELGYIARDERPEDSIMSIPRYLHQRTGAHIVFSVTSRETKEHAKGEALAAFIRKHKLGPIVESTPKVNTYHSGSLKAWLWSPSKAAVVKVQLALLKKNFKRYGYRGTYMSSVFRGDARAIKGAI